MDCGLRSIAASAIELALVLVLAPSALACGEPTTPAALDAWGDDAAYRTLPGGTFDGELTWAATGGAAVVAEQDPVATGAGSVALRSGDSITSPAVCVSRQEPYLRFAVRSLGGGSKLKLRAIWTGEDGEPKEAALDSHESKRYPEWSLSRVVKLDDAVPKDGAVRGVRLRFTVDGKSGSWLVDDVSLASFVRGACPNVPTSAVFEDWGDISAYVAVPGGAFEDALIWSLEGTPVLVEERHPFEIGDAGETAVKLQSGDAIVSPKICVDHNYPHLRFVTRAHEGDAKLKLDVLWTDANGTRKTTRLEDHDGNAYRAWGLSRMVSLDKLLPKGEDARDIRLRFVVEGKTGTWLIDDVYVDPFKRS